MCRYAVIAAAASKASSAAVFDAQGLRGEGGAGSVLAMGESTSDAESSRQGSSSSGSSSDTAEGSASSSSFEVASGGDVSDEDTTDSDSARRQVPSDGPPTLVDSDADEAEEEQRCDSMGESSSSSGSAEVTSDSEGESSTTSSKQVETYVAKAVCDEFAKETWIEHMRVHGPRHSCPRCRFMRDRPKFEATLTYDVGNGETGTWIEQRCTAEHAWGLGCKICRWAGHDSAFARGEVRSDRATALTR